MRPSNSPLVHRFADDHSLLIGLAAATARDLIAGRDARAEVALTLLDQRLRNHIRVAETIVYPSIERLVGDPMYSVTSNMRRQHAIFGECLMDAEAQLMRGYPAEAEHTMRDFGAAMILHRNTEERGLCVIADHLLPATEIAIIASLFDEALVV